MTARERCEHLLHEISVLDGQTRFDDTEVVHAIRVAVYRVIDKLWERERFIQSLAPAKGLGEGEKR